MFVDYQMPKRGHLLAEIYDLRGRRVAVLANEIHEPGNGTIHWDGSDIHGGAVGSGTYFLRTVALGQLKIQQVSLIK